jgi:hypothetical protein
LRVVQELLVELAEVPALVQACRAEQTAVGVNVHGGEWKGTVGPVEVDQGGGRDGIAGGGFIPFTKSRRRIAFPKLGISRIWLSTQAIKTGNCDQRNEGASL